MITFTFTVPKIYLILLFVLSFFGKETHLKKGGIPTKSQIKSHSHYRRVTGHFHISPSHLAPPTDTPCMQGSYSFMHHRKNNMALNVRTILTAILHLLTLRLSGAAINLRVYHDPRDVQYKTNVRRGHHTSAKSCPPVDVGTLEAKQLFQAQDVRFICVLNTLLLLRDRC